MPTGDVSPKAEPAITRAHSPLSSIDRQRRGGEMLERRVGLLVLARQRDPALDAEHALAALRAAGGACAPEWAMPRPAVIRFIAPGVISSALPSLSRCMMRPSNR